jgi:hypothetical protein
MMTPMKPMKPMEPMKPMTPWWPEDLGQPASSGGQNDLQYAYFAGSHRLAISHGGKVTIYDTTGYQIGGVQQQQGGGKSDLSFSSQKGPVSLSDLKQVHD